MPGNDVHTILLIHTEEPTGTVTWTDSSAYSQDVEPPSDPPGNARPYYSTDDYAKFGSTCAMSHQNGSIQWKSIRVLNFDDFEDIGSGVFTIDFWVLRYDDQGSIWFETRGPGNNDIILKLQGTSNGIYVDFLGDFAYTTNTTLTADQWYHIAFERTADGECNLFLDGTSIINFTNTGSINYGAHGKIVDFGAQGSQAECDYAFEEFRISKIDRYEGNSFTPPTEPYDDTPSDIVGEGEFTTGTLDLSSSGAVGAAGDGSFLVGDLNISAIGYLSPAGLAVFKQETGVASVGYVTPWATGNYRLKSFQINAGTHGGVAQFVTGKPVASASGISYQVATGDVLLGKVACSGSGLVASMGTATFDMGKVSVSGSTKNAGAGTIALASLSISARGTFVPMVSGTGSYSPDAVGFYGLGVIDVTEILQYRRSIESLAAGSTDASYSDSVLTFSR